MRVRIVTNVTYPEGMAATSRVRCYAKALREEGAHVTIVAPSNLKKLRGRRLLYRGDNAGVSVELLLNNEKIKNRWINYAWHSIKPFLLALHSIFHVYRYDVCIIYINAVWPRILLVPFLKLARRKIVLELNEYPYVVEGTKYTKYESIRKLLRLLTFRGVFPYVDGAIVISGKLHGVIKKRAPRSKVLVVPILTDSVELRTAQMKVLDDPYLFHAGSLDEQKDGIVSVFEAFAIARHELRTEYGVTLKFVISNRATDSNTWAKIENILTISGAINDVIVTGYLSQDDLSSYERGALAFIVNKPSNLQNEHNFPTKLASYLCAGRPVIAAASGLELNRYLIHKENAFVVEPDNSEQIASAILTCFRNPDLASRLGKNGAETAKESFFYKSYGPSLYGFLADLL